MNKKEERVLLEALEKYAETRNSELITEKVYEQYKKYVQFISNKYSLFDRESIEVKVSIVDRELWKRIKLFDKNKASMATFLSVVIKSAFLMEIRNRKAIKNRTDNLVSFDDIVCDSNTSYDREVRRYEVIGDNDKDISIFELTELFNSALNSYLNTKNPKSRDNIKNVMMLHFNDCDQKAISTETKLSQSYISRAIKDFQEYMNNNIKRFV